MQIVKQMQADSGAYKLVIKEGRNYVGFIAVGPAQPDQPVDSNEVDIAVVFRGTITKDEWIQVGACAMWFRYHAQAGVGHCWPLSADR
jgi:hypothetical protein